MCAGKDALLRVGVFIIVRRYTYHGRLKEWLRRFHGVATKNLANYLGWRRTLEALEANATSDAMILGAIGLGPYQQKRYKSHYNVTGSARPVLNAWRYYRMEIWPDLFGRALLARHWGRIGTHGHCRPGPHPDPGAAANALAALLRAKRLRGCQSRT
jgi:predicted DNA-binding WGR domain protein